MDPTVPMAILMAILVSAGAITFGPKAVRCAVRYYGERMSFAGTWPEPGPHYSCPT